MNDGKRPDWFEATQFTLALVVILAVVYSVVTSGAVPIELAGLGVTIIVYFFGLGRWRNGNGKTAGGS